MEQAPVGVAVFDRDIRFVQVNDRLAKITGLAVDDHIGKRPEQVLSGLAPESYLPSARRALRGEVGDVVEVSGELAAGAGVARSWLQSWAPVRSPGGEGVGGLAFVVEISGRERAEQALREHERRVGVRAQALADLAAGMAAATSVERMAVVVAARAAAAADAEFSNLALLTGDGERLQLYHHESLDERIARRWSEGSLQDPVPLVDAVRRREPVFVHGPEENARRYPALVADTEGAGLAATASLPLLDRHDRALGAMGFAWSQPQAFEAELQSVLRTIAELTGQSLERARLHAGEQRARERAGVLVEATHAIGTPGSTGERLQRLCERLVPQFSDLAVAELPADPGGGMPLAVVHRDPRRRDMLRVLLKLEPYDGPARPGAARILAGAQPELVVDTSRARRDRRAPDREMLELLAALGIDSYLGVPLRAGRAVVGALLLGQSGSGRRFGAEDLAFAADLGERVGLILDNVRLAEAEHE